MNYTGAWEVDCRVRHINSELNRLEAGEGREVLISRPPVVQIPTGSRCNLHCLCCTERSAATAGCYSDKSLDDFLPLAEGLAYAFVVQLWGWGEPFLNPHYPEIFDFVDRTCPAVEINVSSNGTLFDDFWQDKLLRHGNFSINFSLNAATRATYRAVTGRDLFPRVLGNLKRFARRRREVGELFKAYATLSFVTIVPNYREIPAFVDLGAALSIQHVQFMDLLHIQADHPALSVAGRADEVRALFAAARERGKERGIGVGSFLPYAAQDYLAIPCEAPAPLTGEGWPVAGEPTHPCFAPWRQILIGGDGTVTTCCRSGTVQGNLVEQSLEEVWNGPMFRQFRRTVNTAEPPAECRYCPVRYGLDCQ